MPCRACAARMCCALPCCMPCAQDGGQRLHAWALISLHHAHFPNLPIHLKTHYMHRQTHDLPPATTWCLSCLYLSCQLVGFCSVHFPCACAAVPCALRSRPSPCLCPSHALFPLPATPLLPAFPNACPAPLQVLPQPAPMTHCFGSSQLSFLPTPSCAQVPSAFPNTAPACMPLSSLLALPHLCAMPAQPMDLGSKPWTD